MYGPAPPDADTVSIALPPLHVIGVVILTLATNWVGSDTVIVIMLVHAFASVTVYV